MSGKTSIPNVAATNTPAGTTNEAICWTGTGMEVKELSL